MEHLPELIIDLALILITAAAVTLVFRAIKQPLVLGYIIAGFLVGPHLSLTPTIVEKENIETLAEMGVIFLLFSLGLEFSFKKLVRVGGAASITAFVEIIFILVAGFYLGKWMGWSFMDSIFLGGMLASSSTSITIKALDELGMKAKQFARVVYGVLIVQDILVILLMVMLSTVAITRQIEGSEMLFTVARLLFFLGLWFITGIFLIPTLLRRTKKLLNEETLLILSVGLCLGMVVLAVQAGFSAELGAFIMGSILAETSKAEKIEKLFNPIRDLFAGIFFVSVGMLIDPETIIQYRWPVLWITLLTIVGKFLSLTFGAIISGQPLKQSIQVGMSMAQVGEFAFIIATLGMSLGVISNFLFPVAVGAAVITTFTTPFLIKLSIPVYNFAERNMPPYLKKKLDSYSASAQNIQAENKWRTVMLAYVKILTINGIILFGMLLLSLRVLMPFLQRHIESNILVSIIGLLLSLAVAAPFLWAFIARKPETNAYKELWLKKKYNRGPLLMVEIARLILGIVFIGFWADRIFTTTVGIFISIAVSVVLLILFSRKIQNFYKKIEFRFLDNLNYRDATVQSVPAPQLFSDESNMVSWDAHLVNMEVDPHALFIGKHLLELKWREKYGINIAFIKRGSKIIYAPKRYDRLLPFDQIGVIATDDQMTHFMEEFNAREPLESEESDLSNIVLFKMVVDEKNKLRGKTIRNSNIRERSNGLVVGIERENQRMLNPESDFTLEWGDIIWIVGERDKLQSINRSEQA
ncbi:MAG: cation:proton antiporter [Bacteroidetes bacterium]|nr:cation:proton antiporter [Bacteroidota bacterium]